MRRSSASAPMPRASMPRTSRASRSPACSSARVAAAVVGWLSGLVILRTHGLTLLMLTLAVTALLAEAANKASFITGGADGLQGMDIDPIFGLFRFDLFGRTAYLYCLAVLFLAWLFARRLVHSSVRPLADRHPREHRPHARDRLAGAAAAAHHLHDLRRAGRRGRRPAGADHAVRRSHRAQLPALRRDRRSCWCSAASAGCTAPSSVPAST